MYFNLKMLHSSKISVCCSSLDPCQTIQLALKGLFLPRATQPCWAPCTAFHSRAECCCHVLPQSDPKIKHLANQECMALLPVAGPGGVHKAIAPWFPTFLPIYKIVYLKQLHWQQNCNQKLRNG